jgi:hypothetical protein
VFPTMDFPSDHGIVYTEVSSEAERAEL